MNLPWYVTLPLILGGAIIGNWLWRRTRL
jgi:hypothetical protein